MGVCFEYIANWRTAMHRKGEGLGHLTPHSFRGYWQINASVCPVDHASHANVLCGVIER
jgi:hypothetical protein